MAKDLILKVDKEDKVIGQVFKEEAHEGKGVLHRAFLVLLFNKDDQLFLAQRSKFKKLWPSFWDGSVASHFKKGEKLKEAVKKRVAKEAGARVQVKNIKYLFKFYYYAPFEKIGSEREICYTYALKIKGKALNPNPKEISAWKLVDLKDFKRNKNFPKLTPWFKIVLKKLKGRNKIKLI